VKTEFSLQIFEKSPNIKFHEYPSSERRVVSCGRTELIVTFYNFANKPNNKKYINSRVNQRRSGSHTGPISENRKIQWWRMMNQKTRVNKRSCPFVRTPLFSAQECGNPHNPCQDSWCPRWNSNPENFDQKNCKFCDSQKHVGQLLRQHVTTETG
jgi:hypothetical protein